jgi:hypothetical protein
MVPPTYQSTRDLFFQFANAHIAARHVITERDELTGRLAGLIDQQLHTGTFRYSAS